MRRRHGMRAHPLYDTWKAMRQRCQNTKHKDYRYYGGRGITVCKRWGSFQLFVSDMGERPIGGTLERKNNRAGYSPGNCVWATRREQANNRNYSNTITVRGMEMTVSEAARVSGLKICTLWQRLKRGWPIERAIARRA